MQAIAAKLLVLGTGGTIAGRSQVQGDNVGYRAGEVAVDALLPPAVMALPCLAGHRIETRQVAQIDSKDMDHLTWFDLADAVLTACADDAVKGMVITHGTDTIEETSFFLAQLCAPQKPVVLTCAMRPATAISPDGPQNLLDALSVAMDARAAGVWVVTSGAVHAASQVVKVHPYRTDSFSSGEAGPVGLVEEGRVRWLHGAPSASVSIASSASCGAVKPIGLPALDARSLLSELVSKGLPRVEWVVSHAGVTPAAVNVWLTASDDGQPVRGLVLVGTGNGTFHQCLTAPLQAAEAAGVRVWRSTRCTQGQIVLGQASLNWPLATPLDPVKARIALALEIARQDMGWATSSEPD